jgi:hypothetical protein
MLTTLATVKARVLLEDADVKDDDLLNNAIAAASARIENDCNRTFGYTVNAIEEFTGDECEIVVRFYPIDLTKPITFQFLTTLQAGSNQTPGWQTPTQLPDYTVRRGNIITLGNQLATWRDVAHVTYSGGYQLPDGTSPAAATIPLPDDLEQACVEQVAYWYQNRNRLGLVSVSGEGGSISQYAQLDLLPAGKAALRNYIRWSL